tara:strand:- start:73 stop:339 length:267 start_codon:yes stop_codon:yes gene_type:complete
MRNVNPFLCKKGYYVTEQHFMDIPGDGYKMVDSTDIKGPFKTLKRAQQVFNSMFTNEDWNIGIRGPEHDRDNKGWNTIWYPTVTQNSY